MASARSMTHSFFTRARRKRYDLPLHRGSGGQLVAWIVGVMSYLTILMMVLVLALSGIQRHWETSLSGRMTVEIPHQKKDGFLDDTKEELIKKLNALPGIDAKALELSDMEKLVGPWLGTGATLQELPLPQLIDVTVTDAEKAPSVDKIAGVIRAEMPDARLDTHQEWLADLTRLAKACRMVLVAVSFILALTAGVTVAATARTRLALHKEEVALLHLIGATDSYIATQFQRQAFRLATEGAAAGLVLAIITMAIISFAKNQLSDTVVPTIQLSWMEWLLLFATPFFAGLIAMLASRFAVLYSLKRMP